MINLPSLSLSGLLDSAFRYPYPYLYLTYLYITSRFAYENCKCHLRCNDIPAYPMRACCLFQVPFETISYRQP